MKSFYYKFKSGLSLYIRPHVVTYLDGHPIITHVYDLFLRQDTVIPDLDMSKDVRSKGDDPDYYGNITFEKPGVLFSYEEGKRCLSRAEVEELIEYISHVRDNPGLWETENI